MREGWMIAGAGAAVACCALLPVMLATAGGLALGTLLGSGAVLLATAAVVAVLVDRRKRALSSQGDQGS